MRFLALALVLPMWSLPSWLESQEPLADSSSTPSLSLLQQLRKDGIEFHPTFTGNTAWDIAGGQQRTTNGNLEYLIDLNLKIHSEETLKFSGGLFCADFQLHRGGQPHLDAGSYQDLTFIEANNITQLSEFWFRQSFGEDLFWFLIGKKDCSTIFDFSTYAMSFQYQSFESIPTIRNLPYYPNPAMGVLAGASFGTHMNIKLGILDGSNVLGVQTGSLGITGKFFDHLLSHALMIGEVDFIWNEATGLFGQIGGGVWKNSSSVPKYSGGVQKGLNGWYLFGDQTIWQDISTPTPRKIGLFFQAGYTSPQASPIKEVFAFGVNALGPFVTRSQDSLGVGVCMSRFSLVPGSGYTKPTETDIEIYYLYNPYSWWNIQPDIQYIITPNGSSTPNALVVLVNTAFSF